MSNVIYYFSGTGNSLFIAKKLSENIADTVLLNIFAADYNTNYDSIGFVFPVHCMSYPKAIKDFVNKIDISKVKYIYAVCTSGGDSGNLIYNFNRFLMKKQKMLNYGYEIKLADNSLLIETKPILIKKRFLEARELIETISKDVSNGINNADTFKYSFNKFIVENILKMALSLVYQIDDKQSDIEKCNMCGKCTAMCPSKNISISNDKIVFGENCVNCFSCINNCSKGAIYFGKVKPGKYKQYKMPKVEHLQQEPEAF